MENKVSLEDVLTQVRASRKYADMDEALIRAIALHEIAKAQSLKETVKATRNKLHQVGSAFQEAAIPYTRLVRELDELPSDLADPVTRTSLKSFMQYHTSTRERLLILEDFFQQTLASLAPVHSVVDIACGLNPLALPWMPVAEDVHYTACDIYGEMSRFINRFFTKFEINGLAITCDVTQSIPQEAVQLALILKTIPCLEQLDKQAGFRLLESMPAKHMLVTFPAHSLGGRSKGMVQNYEAHFRELVAGKPWAIQRFEFPGELAFLVHKA